MIALIPLWCMFTLLVAANQDGAPPVAVTAPVDEPLGRIEFPNGGPPEAQADFLRGVLLLHSFEYEDAAEAFRAAQALAPRFALAYWGEALTHWHPIWQEEDVEASRAVLARLAETPEARAALASDERERGLLASLELLIGEGSRTERAVAYCAALAELSARWPEDLELAAFHALAILGTATEGRDVPTYMRAAAVAEGVLERAPDHPGALHYAIHSYDDPVHAPLGLRMARRYGVVAAAAEHALHMPSHIYVALGMWRESIESNLAASAAADARRARKGLSVQKRGFHALYWLLYSYLQVGEREKAEGLLADMREDEAEESTKRTRTHLVLMRAAYVLAGDYSKLKGPQAAFDVDLEDLEPDVACAELYVRGRRALAHEDLAAASQALSAMAAHRGPLEELPDGTAGATTCCTTTRPVENLQGRLAARVMELQLSGLIALHSGKRDEGLALLRAATEREDAMGYDFGPPAVVEPAHELYGYILCRWYRDDETGKAAAREFQAALRRAPGRARSLFFVTPAGTLTDDAASLRQMGY
jgi:hypothetical protein